MKKKTQKAWKKIMLKHTNKKEVGSSDPSSGIYSDPLSWTLEQATKQLMASERHWIEIEPKVY